MEIDFSKPIPIDVLEKLPIKIRDKIVAYKETLCRIGEVNDSLDMCNNWLERKPVMNVLERLQNHEAKLKTELKTYFQKL